jgi:hypothetical protein
LILHARTSKTPRAWRWTADALVLRGSMEAPAAAPSWIKLPANLLRTKPSVSQREGEPLPEPLQVLIERALQAPPSITL